MRILKRDNAVEPRTLKKGFFERLGVVFASFKRRDGTGSLPVPIFNTETVSKQQLADIAGRWLKGMAEPEFDLKKRTEDVIKLFSAIMQKLTDATDPVFTKKYSDMRTHLAALNNKIAFSGIPTLVRAYCNLCNLWDIETGIGSVKVVHISTHSTSYFENIANIFINREIDRRYQGYNKLPVLEGVELAFRPQQTEAGKIIVYFNITILEDGNKKYLSFSVPLFEISCSEAGFSSNEPTSQRETIFNAETLTKINKLSGKIKKQIELCRLYAQPELSSVLSSLLEAVGF